MMISSKRPAGLDPDYLPAALWHRAYAGQVAASNRPAPVTFALFRADDSCSHFSTEILPDTPEHRRLNLRDLERTLKFLLWQRGASRVLISGCPDLVQELARIYSDQGERHFDYHFFSESIYRRPLQIQACRAQELPRPHEVALPLGGHLDGCRIGFDLGGSDRKCAALIDGDVVFSDEIPWNPYFETDPQYHIDGINDSLKRAAAHLPRVDAIGGSAAGVYVDNEVRVASLFRGVSKVDFEKRVRHIFRDLRKAWNDVPFEVVNDGEVTALAGSTSLHENGLLGVAMGTSEAVGYVNPEGRITSWLNELAFAPVDYRDQGPVDEWSGDEGCGVQFFSQQGVGRLAKTAGFAFPDDMPLPVQLEQVQEHLKQDDPRARRIFETIGVCFGYTVAHYAAFYDLNHVLALGRVTSGAAGDIILDRARDVLEAEFPDLHQHITLSMPDEKMKRHGQAVAAASLPSLK